MATSEQLHRLISHFTSSEKGYIKKYLNIDPVGNKKNILVFDVLEKQKVLNEPALKQKAGKEYAAIIDFLFSTALNCLENYHKNEKMGIRSSLNQIEILIEKNLYLQAEKIISKVKTLTEKNNYYDLYSEVAEWEITLLGSKPPSDELMKVFDRIFDKLEKDISKQEKAIDS